MIPNLDGDNIDRINKMIRDNRDVHYMYEFAKRALDSVLEEYKRKPTQELLMIIENAGPHLSALKVCMDKSDYLLSGVKDFLKKHNIEMPNGIFANFSIN